MWTNLEVGEQRGKESRGTGRAHTREYKKVEGDGGTPGIERDREKQPPREKVIGYSRPQEGPPGHCVRKR